MQKEEIIRNLSECYTLRNRFKQLDIAIPEELEKRILRYEAQFYILKFMEYEYHHVVEPNDKSFYDSLVEYVPQKTDEIRVFPVDDSFCSGGAVIKQGDKYGIFHISIHDTRDESPRFMSVPQPFKYEEVKITLSFPDRDDVCLVAAKKNGKWGMLDMSRSHCFQIVVGFEYENFYELPRAAEKIIGMPVNVAWIEFKAEDSHDLSDEKTTENTVYLTKDNAKDAEGKQLKVTMPDGTIYCEKNSIQTFIQVLQHIGLNRIPAVGIMCKGYNLVDDRRRTDGRNKWQQEVDGKWVYVYFSNTTKVKYLFQIAEYLKETIRIEAV